jgi:hypothetical protein
MSELPTSEEWLLFPWVRQSLYTILCTELSKPVAKLESWILAVEWLNAATQKQQAVIAEIHRDLAESETSDE